MEKFILVRLQLINLFDLQTAKKMDWFASCKGKSHKEGEGKDAALWHYLLSLNADIIWVAHMDFSTDVHVDIWKCRVLSAIFTEEPLAKNSHKCILVNREAAIYRFGDKEAGSILGFCGLNLGQNISDAKDIVLRIGDKPSVLTLTQEKFSDQIQHM